MITLLGYVLIPIGLSCFLLKKTNLLYKLMIFFIPFSASSIINIGTSDESGSGFQVVLFIGVLFFLSKIIDFMIMDSKILIPRYQQVPIFQLVVFSFFVFVSLVMPCILDNQIYVPNNVINNLQYLPLQFTIRNITQFLYLLFGVFFSVAIAVINENYQTLKLSVKIYIISGMFVGFWGLIQLTLYQLNIPYPSIIFNNSMSSSAQGFDSFLNTYNFKRISSVATEPSIFSQYVLTVIPFLICSILKKKYIISRLVDKFSLCLMIFVLILSTSSTGYMGFLFMLLIVMLFSKTNIKYKYFILGLLLTIVIMFLYLSSANQLLTALLYDKLFSFSGSERINSVIVSFQYFLKYPILGLGWGSITSHDLIINLLANCGILGFVSFAVVITYIIVNLIKSIRKLNDNSECSALINGVFVSLVTLLFVNCISGFTFVFYHFWFLFGLSISTCKVNCFISRNKKIQKNGMCI